MNKTPKTDALFVEIEKLYLTQLYHRGDYCAKVRALHDLLFSFPRISVRKLGFWWPVWPHLTLEDGTKTYRLTR